ncbi:hypothetical protein E4U28_001076, partial [Claviceps purpurea]
ASEPDTVKTTSDKASEPDTVKTAPDKASDPDTVKTAPDKASEPRTAPPTPEPAATLASPSSPQGKFAFNINTKADAGANAESFDRTGLSSNESRTKCKANKPLADEVKRTKSRVI